MSDSKNKTPSVRMGGQSGWRIRKESDPVDDRPEIDRLIAENADLRRELQACREGTIKAIGTTNGVKH